MKRKIRALIETLTKLESGILRFPKTVILLALIASGCSLYYTVENLRINTDTTQILSPNLPFQKDRKRFIQAFPQDDQAILVVVDANTPEYTARALAYLGKLFREEKRQIKSVYIPGEEPFFDQNGLLYLNLEDIQDLAVNLSEAQPFIGKLSKDNSIKGLLSIIELALTTEDRELAVDLNPLLGKIRGAIHAVRTGTNYQLSWQQLMLGKGSDLLTSQRFILLKPELDYSALMPAEQSLQTVRAIVQKAAQAFPDVRVRLTGEVVLEHDELESVQRSAEMATLFSMILVCIALLVGFKSSKLTAATLIVLGIGLLLTAGFATLSVGQVNIISISFAVLYIGIGVDYAVQLSLRYREFLLQNLSQRQALSEAVRRVGPSITLCAMTTSVGFFSFIPTAYTGVSELGIIAGIGMFIALFVTLTVLPALLKVLQLSPAKAKAHSRAFPDWVYRLPIRHRLFVKWGAFVIAIVGLGILTQVKFDFNPINLRDPNTESVAAFKELLKTKQTSPMTLTVLAANKTDALATADRLMQLKSVENAITIYDFVPGDQDAKLEVIEELNLLMGLQMTTFPLPHKDSVENHTRTLQSFQATISKSLADQPDGPLSEALNQLRDELEQYLVKLETDPGQTRKTLLETLQSSLLDTLPDTMNLLLKGLEASDVSIDDLPEDLSERWLNNDGVYRIMIFPAKDLNDLGNLREFIAEVRRLEPTATDLPVIYLESGNAVVKAFQQALLGSLAAISMVLLVLQRNIRETVLILLPLLLTAVITGASTIILNNPFNFANIIIIPLLFGLGVDGGIYMIYRLRHMPGQQEDVLRTSTARGIFFAGITTLCSLVSMSFTPHLGLASMGQLLAIGITLMLFCTLIVLPAFAVRN